MAAVVFATFTVGMTSWQARWIGGLPKPVESVLEHIQPLVSFNAYGLFADMTEVRPEIVVEGSDDGETWKPYGFRWKAGAVERAPGFAGPRREDAPGRGHVLRART